MPSFSKKDIDRRIAVYLGACPLCAPVITHRGHHFQIEILLLVSLRFTLHSTMFSGIRKFCNYHFISQFLFKCIVNVLTDEKAAGM